MKVLLLEDDPGIRLPLAEALREAGYTVEPAGRAYEAEGLALNFAFDAFVVDISLPEGELAGIEVVRRLRGRGVSAPVLYLTGRDGLEDIVAGLDAGGDDYLLKPFRLPELLARLRAQLRRARPSQEPELVRGALSVNWTTGQVRLRGREVHLTAKEYALLELLASHPGRLFTREEIFERVWDSSAEAESNIVEVYVSLLRRKLGEGFVENLRGRGYRFPE